MACKPDSVTARQPPMAIRLGPPSPTGSGSQPGPLGREKPWGRSPARSLFGLAPGGACHAADVAAGAVGSYPTVSPLPAGRSRRAVSSLWRFPSGHPGRALPAAISPWSPDFPRPLRAAAIRPSARAPYVGTRPPVNASASRPHRRHVGRFGLAARPGPEAQPHRREHAVPVAVRRGVARRRGRARGRPPSRRAPAAAVRPDRPPAAREPAPVELRPRIGLAPRRHVGMGDHPGRRDRPARQDPVEQRLERRHLRLRERRKAVERPGVGELDPDRARVHVLRPAPATRRRRARRARASGTSRQTRPSSATR